jgi:type IV pilus assembly protein PilM
VLDQEQIATRHAVVDIPRDQAILKTLTLPRLAPEELPGMVEIQIAKELPFAAGEAVIDFTVGPMVEGATAEVLVAAVRREVVQQYEETFKVAGLSLDRIGLRPYANTLAVREMLTHSVPERVVFIDVRPTLTEINVLRHGALAFSRAASVVIPKDWKPGKAAGPRLSLVREAAVEASIGEDAISSEPLRIKDADAVIASLMVEVTRSIEAYRVSDAGAAVDQIVIAGDLGVEEALAEAIHKKLGVHAEMYNPAASFGWEPDEGAGASAFSSTLGMVFGQAAPADMLHFDFLHPKKRTSAAKERLRKAPIAAAVAALFLTAGAVAIAKVTGPQRRELARIEEQIGDLEAQRPENRKFMELMTRVREFDARQHVWVDVLHDIVKVLPTTEQLVVTQLDMNQEDGRLVLKTKAKDRNTPTIAVNRLEEFRREGKDLPRFKVGIGPQSEKKGEKYPYQQDLRIAILNDDVATKSAKKTGNE